MAGGRALSGEVLPPALPSPPLYRPQPEAQESLLKNPYVLAGLAVAGAVFLAVIVVFFFGSGDGGGADGGDGPGVVPLTPLPGRGLAARSIATATVREGPNAEYLEIGLLRSGQDVEVVGRNAESTWFQIYYPPQSQLRGWVPASALRIPETGAAGIPVVAVTPIPRPTVIQPTPEPVPTGTATPTPTITGTPGAGSGPDLAISILGNNCEPGQPLIVMVQNAGSTPITNREMRVIVSNPSGVLSVANISAPSIDPGASIPVQTNQLVQPPRTTVRVDLLGAPPDPNGSNNQVDCVAQGAPTPTRTPRN
jgi:hypothetical protein